MVEVCRPHAKVPPRHLRRTISAILWRHANGAKWRSLPPELGSWWMAAQTFIRWSRLGVWERLLVLAQERVGPRLGQGGADPQGGLGSRRPREPQHRSQQEDTTEEGAAGSAHGRRLHGGVGTRGARGASSRGQTTTFRPSCHWNSSIR